MSAYEYINKPFEAYDQEKEFDLRIKPVLEELRAQCKCLNLPMFVLVAFKQEADGSNRVFSGTSFLGDGRTPIKLIAAHAAANRESVENAVMMHKLDMLRRFHQSPKPGNLEV